MIAACKHQGCNRVSFHSDGFCASHPSRERFIEELDYDPDTGEFKWKRRFKNRKFSVGSIDKDGYLIIELKGAAYKAHRLAWLFYYGVWPNKNLDHINRNKLDNSIKNLREVEIFQNLHNFNKRSDNTSGVTGVYWMLSTRKWAARIRVNYETIYLGCFPSKEEAITARLAAEEKYRHITLAPRAETE